VDRIQRFRGGGGENQCHRTNPGEYLTLGRSEDGKIVIGCTEHSYYIYTDTCYHAIKSV
jgi:hypothetical protein